MRKIPIRAILSFATLVGVVTGGAVLILGAPPSHSDLIRRASKQATRTREMTREIRNAMDQGRLRDAERLTKRYTDASPNDPTAWLYYSLVRQRQGEHTDARLGWGRLLALTRQPPGRGGMSSSQMFMRAWAHYGAGRKRDAFRLWWQAANSAQGRAVGGERFYELASTLASSGEYDDAIDALHLAIDSGYRQIVVLDADPALDPLRSSPRFAQAIDRLARRSMGRFPVHGDDPHVGETPQILSLEPPIEERVRRWVERWGDL